MPCKNIAEKVVINIAILTKGMKCVQHGICPNGCDANCEGERTISMKSYKIHIWYINWTNYAKMRTN